MTREAVLIAGERLLRSGARALTMRRLAAALTMAPGTLYHHVPGGLDELRAAIGARMLDRCTRAVVRVRTPAVRAHALESALVVIYRTAAAQPPLAEAVLSPRGPSTNRDESWNRLLDALSEQVDRSGNAVSRGILSQLVMALLLLGASSTRHRRFAALAQDLITVTLAGARKLAPTARPIR
ncbi:MAG: TetR/AcrR family transcriptional regulator [Vicinamibacterales bacterium]